MILYEILTKKLYFFNVLNIHYIHLMFLLNVLSCLFLYFSPPEPKVQVGFPEHLLSVVLPSV